MTNRLKSVWLIGSLLIFSASMAFSQTLADAARAQQSKNKAGSATGHVYTNDSMEFHPAPAVTAPAKTSDSDSAVSNGDKAAADASSADAPDSADAKKKAADDLKEKVTKQIAEIAQLQRELNILLRESQIRAAEYYADAGSRLRNSKTFDDADRKYKTDIAAKQKAITDAQATLDKLREEARRAGVAVS